METVEKQPLVESMDCVFQQCGLMLSQSELIWPTSKQEHPGKIHVIDRKTEISLLEAWNA